MPASSINLRWKASRTRKISPDFGIPDALKSARSVLKGNFEADLVSGVLLPLNCSQSIVWLLFI